MLAEKPHLRFGWVLAALCPLYPPPIANFIGIDQERLKLDTDTRQGSLSALLLFANSRFPFPVGGGHVPEGALGGTCLSHGVWVPAARGQHP